MIGLKFVLLVQTLYFTDAKAGSSLTSHEKRLINDLFTNYNPSVRPVLNSSKPVQLELGLAMSKMEGINSKDQTFAVSGWLVTNWKDEFLVWDPQEYGGIERITVDPSNLWLPDFALFNSGAENLYNRDWYTLFRAPVSYDGSVAWPPGGVFESKCTIDVLYYPFDDQVCELVFINWAYTGEKVNLTVPEGAENTLLSSYTENSEWSIEDTVVFAKYPWYECCPEGFFPEIHFRMRVRHKALFYVMNIILPSVMLSFLTLFVFTLPPDSGEKISMGLTLLLSYSVFLLMVSDDVPNTSDGVPLLVLYLLFSMAITCLTVIISTFVLIMHFSVGDPPRWLTKVTFRYMARLICRKDSLPNRVSSEGSLQTSTTNLISHNATLGKNNNNRESGQDKTIIEDLDFPSVKQNRDNMNGPKDELAREVRNLSVVLATINPKQAKRTDEEENIWYKMAIIWDRFFFWSFLVAQLMITPVMFGIVPAFKAIPNLIEMENV